MSPHNLMLLELASALAGPRLVAMRLGLTLLLGGPLVLVTMPLKARVVGLVMLSAFSSFFGAAVAMTRARADGRLERLHLWPLPPWLLYGDWLLAHSAVDILQLAPLYGLYLLGRADSPGVIPALLGALCLALVVLNALGLALGRLLQSNAEVHLGAALALGLLVLTSGLIPLPAALGPLVATLAAINPLAWLAGALWAAAGAGGGLSPAWPLAALGLGLALAARCLPWRAGGRLAPEPPDPWPGQGEDAKR